jgi:hypothetical protein
MTSPDFASGPYQIDEILSDEHRVHFLNNFLFLAGPEGSSGKNFKKETHRIHKRSKTLRMDVSYYEPFSNCSSPDN